MSNFHEVLDSEAELGDVSNITCVFLVQCQSTERVALDGKVIRRWNND